jgi:hypothetical protein
MLKYVVKCYIKLQLCETSSCRHTVLVEMIQQQPDKARYMNVSYLNTSFKIFQLIFWKKCYDSFATYTVFENYH